MYITKINITNFKCFAGEFSLDLNDGLNILVGDNESGKSTILEAIHLALSGWICGRYIGTELSQSLFNSKVVSDYLEKIKAKDFVLPPPLLIELYFDIEDDSIKALFEGTGNSKKHSACGLQFRIEFNERYKQEYEILIDSGVELSSLPIEYYDFSWSSFARDDRITPKIIPVKSALIDSSNSRYQNGSDIYISRIIKDLLTEEQKIEISQAHRKLRDSFAQETAVKNINLDLDKRQISDKKVELSVDLSTKTAWETSLTTYIDDIPFNYIGRGEQCLVKTKLALSHKKTQEASLLLIEEPENHLSHSKLNKLIGHIKENHHNKQIIVSTHSSFVANKLGLSSLILLNVDQASSKRNKARMTELTEGTKKYFERLAGFDTLRMILCRKAILVEGPSDELIVQRAYLDTKSILPIEDEVDVISVGTSFLRFLEIAEIIKKTVAVVTDNDGDFDINITKKYEPYKNCESIKLCSVTDDQINTLEVALVDANKQNMNNLYEILQLDKSKYPNNKSISDYMIARKTESALTIFDSEKNIKYPDYILDAISWEHAKE